MFDLHLKNFMKTRSTMLTFANYDQEAHQNSEVQLPAKSNGPLHHPSVLTNTATRPADLARGVDDKHAPIELFAWHGPSHVSVESGPTFPAGQFGKRTYRPPAKIAKAEKQQVNDPCEGEQRSL